MIEPRSVPLPLRDALFGQPNVIKGRSILSLRTCPFQGAAAEELRDVAPWIVRLEVQHSFTRSLFTGGDARATQGNVWD